MQRPSPEQSDLQVSNLPHLPPKITGNLLQRHLWKFKTSGKYDRPRRLVASPRPRMAIARNRHTFAGWLRALRYSFLTTHKPGKILSPLPNPNPAASHRCQCRWLFRLLLTAPGRRLGFLWSLSDCSITHTHAHRTLGTSLVQPNPVSAQSSNTLEGS